jgi:hypothetical protein
LAIDILPTGSKVIAPVTPLLCWPPCFPQEWIGHRPSFFRPMLALLYERFNLLEMTGCGLSVYNCTIIK